MRVKHMLVVLVAMIVAMFGLTSMSVFADTDGASSVMAVSSVTTNHTPYTPGEVWGKIAQLRGGAKKMSPQMVNPLASQIIQGMIDNPQDRGAFAGAIRGFGKRRLYLIASKCNQSDGQYLLLLYYTKVKLSIKWQDAGLYRVVTYRLQKLFWVSSRLWDNPEVTNRLDILKNYPHDVAAELFDIVCRPYFKTNQFIPTWASDSMWDVRYAMNIAEFAKRSEFVRTLENEHLLTVYSCVYANFRWSHWPPIEIDLTGI